MPEKTEHVHEPATPPIPDPLEPEEDDEEYDEPHSLLSIPPHDGGKCKRGWTRAELAEEMKEQ